MVSEPWANRHHLTPGMSVQLPTPSGNHTFRVAAIYRDYANERGTLAMSRVTALRHWPSSVLSRAGVGLYLRPGQALSAVARELPLSSATVPVILRSRAELSEYSLQIFDRTFAITRLLALLAVAVSLTGVTAALLAQILERLREQATLRALGAARGFLLRVMCAQALMMGGVASLLAIPLGLATGAFLVHVVNLHAFGWTMPLTMSPRLCANMAAGGLVACLIAVLPALARLLRVQPAAALREE
jgi:putative ABC transport system permease protein